MSAYLIAQLGKNYANGMEKEIAGKELIKLAWMIIENTQYMFGGMVSMSLYSFYDCSETTINDIDLNMESMIEVAASQA